MNLAACKRLTLQPINAIWYRAISGRALGDGIRTEQTMHSPTRYNPGQTSKTPFETLYLAENPLVAYYEIGALFGPPDQSVVASGQEEGLSDRLERAVSRSRISRTGDSICSRPRGWS